MDCERYELDDTDGLKLYVSKAEWFNDTLTTAKEVMAECNRCIYWEFCKDWKYMIRELDKDVLNNK